MDKIEKQDMEATAALFRGDRTIAVHLARMDGSDGDRWVAHVDGPAGNVMGAGNTPGDALRHLAGTFDAALSLVAGTAPGTRPFRGWTCSCGREERGGAAACLKCGEPIPPYMGRPHQ